MSSTIIVVEDNPNLNRLFSRKLTHTGYLCISADSVSSARDTLDHITPDAIILDLGLPDGSGDEILEYMQQQPRFQDTVRIIVTGQSHRDLRTISQYNPDFVLLKPVSPRELMLLVNHEMRSREEETDTRAYAVAD